jgi:hypothetical protein
MHGEILEISCCSITVKSDISGGDGLGSILLSSEYNCIMFLSIEQRLHTSDVLNSQPTNSSGSKKRKGSKISLLTLNLLKREGKENKPNFVK